MHGPGIAHPQSPRTPTPGMLALLRVLFVVLPLLTCGFLSWAATLRVAVVTRSVLNWWLFVGNVALSILWIVYLAQDNTNDFSSAEGNIGMIGMLSTGAAAISYFLYADFKHYRVPAGAYAGYYPPPGPQHGYQPPANAGYGYGGPTRPVAAPEQPYQQPGPGPAAPVRAQRNHATPPPRIDQVRAELDELSDLLRRDSGNGRDSGNSDGGGGNSGEGDKR
ncbi:hypothetical protein ACFUN8_02170 [Streptomyces sp. NPDC057307]|uniref:hypothetical protein n=1 Tax=Streptomyces sp. NPDC057307 TaxID=3346096 RepID=UPI00363E658D